MKGDKREQIASELYVGFGETKVISCCPDMEKLEELGYTVEKEPEYTSEKDGINRVRIDFYMQDIKNGHRFKKSFFLEDTDVCQKIKDDWDEETIADFVPKYQYVNQTGDSAWVVDETDLQNRFTKFTKKDKDTGDINVYGDKLFRVAKVGEADLLSFIRKWQGNFNYMSVNTNILLDLKRLFNGKFSELQEGVAGEFATNTVELLGVKTVDKEGDINQYQSVWKESLPGYTMKMIRNTKFTEENIQKWASEKKTKDNPDGRYLKNHEQFAVEVMGEYGFKDYFELCPMKKYEAEVDLAVKGEPSTTNSDY